MQRSARIKILVVIANDQVINIKKELLTLIMNYYFSIYELLFFKTHLLIIYFTFSFSVIGCIVMVLGSVPVSFSSRLIR